MVVYLSLAAAVSRLSCRGARRQYSTVQYNTVQYLQGGEETAGSQLQHRRDVGLGTEQAPAQEPATHLLQC